nr:MAG TPA: hypothetical protein [Bacteriophage sp.]
MSFKTIDLVCLYSICLNLYDNIGQLVFGSL